MNFTFTPQDLKAFQAHLQGAVMDDMVERRIRHELLVFMDDIPVADRPVFEQPWRIIQADIPKWEHLLTLFQIRYQSVLQTA